ncbi:MAG: hypothetical protein PHP08_00685 [Candidatus Dojkabacteria bacterium]|nr:hypothetical protein [Candidatus Dojkabacteria bacterium]
MKKMKTKKKVKVSHTIDEKYLKLMDLDIENKTFGSRSHAIEYALKKLFDSIEKES